MKKLRWASLSNFKLFLISLLLSFVITINAFFKPGFGHENIAFLGSVVGVIITLAIPAALLLLTSLSGIYNVICALRKRKKIFSSIFFLLFFLYMLCLALMGSWAYLAEHFF